MKKKIAVAVPMGTALKLKKEIERNPNLINEVANKALELIEKEEGERDKMLSEALESLRSAREKIVKALEYHKRLPKRFSADFRHNAVAKLGQIIEWAEKELFWIAGKDEK